MFKHVSKVAYPALAAALWLSCAAYAGEADSGDAGGGDKKKQSTSGMEALQEIFGGGGMGGGGKDGGGKGRADVKTVKALLAKERNVKISEMNGKIFLDGRVTSPQIRKRIDTLLTTFDNLVDLTEYQPDEDTMLADTETIKQRIEETLNKNYDTNVAFTQRQLVNVQLVNDKIVVAGEINNADNVTQALQIAKIYNDQVVSDLSVKRQMIEIAAIFAKVTKKTNSSLGTNGLQSAIFTLPSLVMAAPEDTVQATRYPFDIFKQFKTTATSGSAGFNLEGSSEADNLLKMDFSEGNNKDVVLARPHLATINGEEADFLAGGEKAIKTETANTSDVEYKKYGVILKTKPALTTEGKIELHVELEFSIPDGDDFISFVHKGKAVLSRNQGMVLSGLINEARSRGIDRTPYVSSIPILNYFFGKKTSSNDGEELVLLVIPRLPNTVSRAPYATSGATPKVIDQAQWINKPSLPKRIFHQAKEGEDKEYWVKDKVIIDSDQQITEPAKSGGQAAPAAPAPADGAAQPAGDDQPADKADEKPIDKPAPAPESRKPEAAPATSAEEIIVPPSDDDAVRPQPMSSDSRKKTAFGGGSDLPPLPQTSEAAETDAPEIPALTAKEIE